MTLVPVGCPQRLLLGDQEVKTELGIWVQRCDAFLVRWRATDAPDIQEHQAAPDEQTHLLSSSFRVGAAHWQGSHLHPRSLNVDIWDLTLPGERRWSHLPQHTHAT